MIILGIDPGTARMGWGAIQVQSSKRKEPSEPKEKNGEVALNDVHEEVFAKALELLGYGCIVTEKTDGVGKRLKILRSELTRIIKQHTPDLMAVERLFFGMNAKTAIAVGQATGIIMLTASEMNVPVIEYTGLQVKLTVAGYGRAEKEEVQRRVRHLLGSNRRTLSFTAKDHGWDDASDALAIAICHTMKQEV